MTEGPVVSIQVSTLVSIRGMTGAQPLRGELGCWAAKILDCLLPHYCRISNISVGHIIFTLSGYDHWAMRSGNERSKVSS